MTKSSERLNSDITRDKYDPLYPTKLIEKGNNLKDIPLTSMDYTTFEGETTDFKRYVWRGSPDPVKMNWHSMPVFRVQTIDFQDTGEDDFNGDWNRFLRALEIDLSGMKDQALYYEPDISDVRVEDDSANNWAFPLWVIEKLLDFNGMNLIEAGLHEDKILLPKTKKLTKPQYDAIMKEIEKRRNDKLPRSTEQSESEKGGEPAVRNSRRK